MVIFSRSSLRSRGSHPHKIFCPTTYSTVSRVSSRKLSKREESPTTSATRESCEVTSYFKRCECPLLISSRPISSASQIGHVKSTTALQHTNDFIFRLPPTKPSISMLWGRKNNSKSSSFSANSSFTGETEKMLWLRGGDSSSRPGRSKSVSAKGRRKNAEGGPRC